MSSTSRFDVEASAPVQYAGHFANQKSTISEIDLSAQRLLVDLPQ